MVTKKQGIFQLSYMFLWIFIATGIAGNMELERTTPGYVWIIFIALSFLTLGKIFYWFIQWIRK